MPLSLVNVLIRVDHTTFTLRQAVDPVAVVAIAIFVEEGTSAMLLIFVPITSVLTAQFVTLVLPVGALTMALIDGPHALILVLIRVELDTESFLAVITPVANVLLRGFPLLALDCSILSLVFLADPVNAAMRSILLSLSIIAAKSESKTVKSNVLAQTNYLHFPEMHELALLRAH